MGNKLVDSCLKKLWQYSSKAMEFCVLFLKLRIYTKAIMYVYQDVIIRLLWSIVYSIKKSKKYQIIEYSLNKCYLVKKRNTNNQIAC